MEPGQMRKLWIGHRLIDRTRDVQETALVILFWMINSSNWTPRIVVEKRKLLECFASVSDNSWPLKGCLVNLERTRNSTTRQLSLGWRFCG